MSRFRTLLAATATVALASLVPLEPAQAQSFCGGTVVANSFYRTLTDSSQSGTTINHWVQLQNQAAPRHIRIAFFSSEPGLVRGGGQYTVHPGIAPASSNDTAIGNYSQITVLLGTQRVSDPSGRGGIPANDPQTGLPHYTGVTCTAPR